MRIGCSGLERLLSYFYFFFIWYLKSCIINIHDVSQKSDKSCPFSFFDVKGWIVMAVMITFGIIARNLGWFPESFISFFYTGLSLALMFTGCLFIRQWWLQKGCDSKQ